MLNNYIELILYITGGVTATMVGQFLAPGIFLKTFNKLPMNTREGIFFARHWGLVIAISGGLLIYAGSVPVIRTPILIAASIQKAAFVFMILAEWKTFGKGFIVALVFDSLCVVLYVLYLVGI